MRSSLGRTRLTSSIRAVAGAKGGAIVLRLVPADVRFWGNSGSGNSSPSGPFRTHTRPSRGRVWAKVGIEDIYPGMNSWARHPRFDWSQVFVMAPPSVPSAAQLTLSNPPLPPLTAFSSWSVSSRISLASEVFVFVLFLFVFMAISFIVMPPLSVARRLVSRVLR
jgi:hypothetical protein